MVMDYELDETKVGGGETNSRVTHGRTRWVSWNSGRVLLAKGDTEDIKEALDDQATRMGR